MNSTLPNDRAAWIEPSIITLDVAETATNKGAGTDGGQNGTPDFSKS